MQVTKWRKRRIIVATTTLFGCGVVIAMHFYKTSSLHLSKKPPSKPAREPWRLEDCGIHNLTKHVSYPDCKPFTSTYSTCAFVTGSGHMIGSKLGKEIDGHDCVVRPNDAHVIGYEDDVGSKTTIRTVHPTALKTIGAKVKSNQSFDSTFRSTIFVLITFSTERDMSVFEGIASKFLSDFPASRIFVQSVEGIQDFREAFKNQVEKPTRTLWMTNGFVTLLFLKEYCDKIDVYGIAPPDYCFRGLQDVPYHYYDEVGLECEVFAEAHTMHRFLKEKTVFQNWKNEWKNLEFRAPEWQ